MEAHFMFLCALVNCNIFFSVESKKVIETLTYFKNCHVFEKNTRVAVLTACIALDYLLFVHEKMK